MMTNYFVKLRVNIIWSCNGVFQSKTRPGLLCPLATSNPDFKQWCVSDTWLHVHPKLHLSNWRSLWKVGRTVFHGVLSLLHRIMLGVI